MPAPDPRLRAKRAAESQGRRAERVAADYRSFLLQHRPEVVDAT